jgi:nitrogen regulatory protein PII
MCCAYELKSSPPGYGKLLLSIKEWNMFMVLCVIDDPGKVDEVLGALEAGGMTGATIMESTGLHRKREKSIPLRYLYTSPEPFETDNITLFTIVPDAATADKCRRILESVVGDLEEPNTGIFASWQLDQVKGLSAQGRGEGKA